MREYFGDVAGNAALRRRLGQDICADAFSHAYILEGPEGSGKSTLAMEIAMALACRRRKDSSAPLPCKTCPACRKIAAGNSPDVIHIRRREDKVTMGVDVIRDLRADVITVPNDLSVKIYLIHDAHTMTVQAQNALLLTLEEPPSFVLFFLLAEDAGAMLETIRSRAPVLRMQPVSDGEMRQYLLSDRREAKVSRAVSALMSKSTDEFTAVLRMANGCVGNVISLLDEAKRAPLMEQRAQVLEICRLLAFRGRPDELSSRLLALGKKREDVIDMLQLLQTALRDLILLCYSESVSLLFFTEQETPLELCNHFTAGRLAGISAIIDDTLSALAANGNVRLLLVQLQNRLSAQ